jgi:vancomycin resistance protein YoaR
VAYLPIGLDATVAYGESDLKFANNTKAPVYIAYSFANQRLRATIYGAKVAGRRVSLRPAVQKLGPGKINAQLYRVIKQNGKVAGKERIFAHQYRWEPKKQ